MLLLFGRLGCRLLTGKQADQALDQALEQIGLGGLNRFNGSRRSRRGACRGECLDGGFLAYDGAGLANRSRLFHFNRAGGVVAGFTVKDRFVVVAQALDIEMRGVHVRVWQNQYANAGACFGFGQSIALFVQQEGGNRYRHVGADFGCAFLQGFFFDQAQNRQRQGFDIANGAAAITARADDTAGFTQRRTQALTRHFQQAKARDAANLNAGAIGFQALANAFLNGALVFGRRHIDEVDNN